MSSNEPPETSDERQHNPPRHHAMDYESKSRNVPDDEQSGGGRYFLGGLFIGVAISAAVWIAGWNAFDRSSWGMGIVGSVVLGKFFASLATLLSQKWRHLGIGLLVSLPIGALIFFGSCAMHFHL